MPSLAAKTGQPPYGQAPWGLVHKAQRVVLSSIPEGACACGAEGHMASIGPLALGAKGCVERLHPTGETTHYDLCVAGASAPLLSLTHWIFRSLMLPYKSSSHSAKCVRCASLRSGGRRLAVRIMMECHFCALPRTPFCHYVAFPLKGKQEI